MADPRALARTLGVAIELADLGAWGGATLVAEYDPDGPLIRLNLRALPAGPPAAVRAHADAAIAHELYHHGEATGAIARLGTREARERSAAEHRV